MSGLGSVGFGDDFIKIYRQTSPGLPSGAYLVGQVVVGVAFALLVQQQRFAASSAAISCGAGLSAEDDDLAAGGGQVVEEVAAFADG